MDNLPGDVFGIIVAALPFADRFRLARVNRHSQKNVTAAALAWREVTLTSPLHVRALRPFAPWLRQLHLPAFDAMCATKRALHRLKAALSVAPPRALTVCVTSKEDTISEPFSIAVNHLASLASVLRVCVGGRLNIYGTPPVVATMLPGVHTLSIYLRGMLVEATADADMDATARRAKVALIAAAPKLRKLDVRWRAPKGPWMAAFCDGILQTTQNGAAGRRPF